MDNNGNLHAGHRERVLNKLLSNPSAFSEHELLEALLFYFLPRKNTNELAHRLLRAFGSAEKVFNASSEQLLSIEGVGEKVAGALVLFGQFLKSYSSKKKEQPYIVNLSCVKEFVENYFDLKFETFALLLLDKNRKLITDIRFSDCDKGKVTADVSDFVTAFALHKPNYVIIAHNHPSNIAKPSADDDATTKKINLLCTAHGVELDDHVIVCKDKVYSYRSDGRLDRIKSASNLVKILNGQGE